MTVTAAQWFAISGVLAFMFGAGLLAVTVRSMMRRPRRSAPPVLVVRQASWAAPPRTGHRPPTVTRIMPRVDPTTRPHGRNPR